jgi:hypothetical protein
MNASRSALALLVGAVTYILVLARGARLLGDGDTYWQIASGNWILQHRTVPHADPFSFTMPGAPWVDHEWLGQVLMALAWNAGGWSGLVLLAAFAVALALGVLCWRLARWLPPLPNLGFVALAYLTVLPGLLCRPHLLALPVMVTWVGALVAARAEWRPPHWALIPLMALWANLHGSFPAGLLPAVPLAAEAMLAAPAGRRHEVAFAWGSFIGASVLAACATPNLLQGLVHPLRIMAMAATLRVTDEWRSPDFQHLQPLEIWLVVALGFALARGVRLPPIRILLLFGLLHAGLQHARNQILLGLIGPVILAAPLAAVLARRNGGFGVSLERIARPLRIVALTAALAVTALFVLHPLSRSDDRATPSAALAHLPPTLASAPVLNSYDFGGYLIFRSIRPYIDGRADMYGDAFVADYLAILLPRRDKLEIALRDHAIAWTMFKPGDEVVALLDSLPEWHRTYSDDVAVVHVRSEGIAATTSP